MPECVTAEFLVIMRISLDHDVKETTLSQIIPLIFRKSFGELAKIAEHDAYRMNHG